jgi:hypothetical protein
MEKQRAQLKYRMAFELIAVCYRRKQPDALCGFGLTRFWASARLFMPRFRSRGLASRQ